MCIGYWRRCHVRTKFCSVSISGPPPGSELKFEVMTEHSHTIVILCSGGSSTYRDNINFWKWEDLKAIVWDGIFVRKLIVTSFSNILTKVVCVKPPQVSWKCKSRENFPSLLWNILVTWMMNNTMWTMKWRVDKNRWMYSQGPWFWNFFVFCNSSGISEPNLKCNSAFFLYWALDGDMHLNFENPWRYSDFRDILRTKTSHQKKIASFFSDWPTFWCPDNNFSKF